MSTVIPASVIGSSARFHRAGADPRVSARAWRRSDVVVRVARRADVDGADGPRGAASAPRRDWRCDRGRRRHRGSARWRRQASRRRARLGHGHERSPRARRARRADAEFRVASRLGQLREHRRVFDGGLTNFIYKGTNGRWRDVLHREDIENHERTAAENLTADCAHWLATGELPPQDAVRQPLGLRDHA